LEYRADLYSKNEIEFWLYTYMKFFMKFRGSVNRN
jgi:hypothetical protein